MSCHTNSWIKLVLSFLQRLCVSEMVVRVAKRKFKNLLQESKSITHFELELVPSDSTCRSMVVYQLCNTVLINPLDTVLDILLLALLRSPAI